MHADVDDKCTHKQALTHSKIKEIQIIILGPTITLIKYHYPPCHVKYRYNQTQKKWGMNKISTGKPLCQVACSDPEVDTSGAKQVFGREKLS